MQNKSATWIFTILLAAACLFQISYSWVTNSVEKDAENDANNQLVIIEDSLTKLNQTVMFYGVDSFDLKVDIDRENLKRRLEEDYLRKVANEPAYPLLGETYQECKERELSLGLDLKGGMAVTLEVSIPDLLNNLAGKSKNLNYRKAYEAALAEWNTDQSQDFIEIFYDTYVDANPQGELASIFNLANSDKFQRNMTNAQVIEKIRSEKESALSNIEQIMNNRINKFGVSNASLQRLPGSGRIMIELPGVKDKLRVRKLLQSTANLEFWETYNNNEAFEYLQAANVALSSILYPGFAEEIAKRTDTSKVAPVIEDSAAVAENVIPNDTNKTVNETLATTTPPDSLSAKSDSLTQEDQFKLYPTLRYLQLAIDKTDQGQFWEKGSRIGVCQLSDTAKLMALIRHPELKSVWPKELKLLWGAKPDMIKGNQQNFISLYCIKKRKNSDLPPLDGGHVTEANQDFDQNGLVQVLMQMDQIGSEKWANLTDENTGKAIAIVMDDYVYSAPMVEGKITGGRSSISGSFTLQEATDLANVLKSGTLPAKAQIVDEVIVGPTLGADNVTSGIYSFILALVVVLIYMYVYYKKAGLIANISLIANLFFLFGALASIQASLTLPGIAGIVLTIGMAVDANVLIFERIREELREGKGLKMAVSEGFKRAMSSIIDGNLTTLLTAIVLATFGSGPILGFATTLIIGIFTSLFSAIFVSRLIIYEFLDRKKDVSFSSKLSENFMINSKINFMGKRKIAYVFSSLIILGGIGSLAVRGLDYGVEFTGGRTFEIRFDEEAQYDKIKSNLTEVFVDEKGQHLAPEVKLIENKYRAKITTKFMVNDQSPEASEIVDSTVKAGLKEWEGKYEIDQQRKVGAMISGELIWSSIWAITFSLIIIFAYILIRFQRWQFGLAAVLALFHDAMVVIGVFSIFYGVLPFSLEIDQAFIAAVLTVVGYSINDTVIVFDRIREYVKDGKRVEGSILINSALNSTLSRTINTSLTTLVVLVVIFAFGGEAIKGFTFALLVGIGVGTYSSLFVASPLVYDLAGKSINEANAVAKS